MADDDTWRTEAQRARDETARLWRALRPSHDLARCARDLDPASTDHAARLRRMAETALPLIEAAMAGARAQGPVMIDRRDLAVLLTMAERYAVGRDSVAPSVVRRLRERYSYACQDGERERSILRGLLSDEALAELDDEEA